MRPPTKNAFGTGGKMDLTLHNTGANKFHDYLLVVEGSSRRLENRLRRYAHLVFKGCFVNGVTIYHVNVENLETLRRLKISLKKVEDSCCRVLKFEPLLKKDGVILMVF